MANAFYRLRIRNAADTADALVITSVRGGSNPYILEPPRGDGQSFDPLTGEVMTGAYTFSVVDAEIGADDRVLTGALADVNARQQLLSRKAYAEQSADGAAWTIMVPGYVTAVRLPSAIRGEIQIGQARRIEATRTIFRNDQSYFNQVTNLIGGPIRGGWGPIRDQGGWRVRVNQINTTYNYVQLKTVEAFDPRRIGTPFWGGRVPPYVLRETNDLARPYYRRNPQWDGARIRGWFPGLFYRVENLDGTLNTFKTALAEPQEPGHPEDLITRSEVASFWLDWAPAGAIAVGQQFNLYLYPGEVSENNPLHILAHPIDIVEQLWIENGIAYDSAVLPALKELIGPTRQLMLRITAPWRLGEFLKKIIYGPFGLATRIDDTGRQVLFSTRIKPSSSPASTITLADIADPRSTIFDLDESTVANRVTFRTERYSELVNFPTDQTPTPDAVYVTPVSVSVENGDTSTVGDREITYEIPGTMAISGVDLEQFVTGTAREIFDRFGRGAIASELNCLSSVDALLGEEVELDLPHLPNAVVGQVPVSQRGGSRIVQVVRRTETPHGPILKVIDSGTTAQASTVPTLSIAAGSDVRKLAIVTITNAAALAAAGLMVRLEMGTGASQPAAGALLTIVDPAAETTVGVPAQDAGTRVWVRARSEKEGKRPSGWSAWVDVQLTALSAPSGLTVDAEDATQPYRRVVRWTAGANAFDALTEVLLRKTAEAAGTERIVAVAGAGVESQELRGLEAGDYTVSVRHREATPFNGVSASASTTFTTTATVADPDSGDADPSSLINFRQLSETETERTYTWVPGREVLEVWAAWKIFETPMPDDPWAEVIALALPLAVGENSVTVPIPAEGSGQTVFLQVEPRRRDLSPGPAYRAIVEANPPDIPAIVNDDAENATTGTLFIKIRERGIAVTAVQAQTQVGDSPFSAFGTPTRAEGAVSVVNGGTLGAGEYEHDVALDTGRFSWITFRITLETGEQMTVGPVGYDPTPLPNILSHNVSGTTIAVIGDSDVASWKIRDKTGTWEHIADGYSVTVDVSKPGTNGVAGIGSGDTRTYEAIAYNLPSAYVDGSTLSDTRDILVQGSTAPAVPVWDLVGVAAPAEGDATVELTLDADSAPVGHTVRVWESNNAGGTFSAFSNVTASLSPVPGAPPTSATVYDYPTGYQRAPISSTTTLISYRFRCEILNAALEVVATATAKVDWYYEGPS
jgi:hypothetical protein